MSQVANFCFIFRDEMVTCSTVLVWRIFLTSSLHALVCTSGLVFLQIITVLIHQQVIFPIHIFSSALLFASIMKHSLNSELLLTIYAATLTTMWHCPIQYVTHVPLVSC